MNQFLFRIQFIAVLLLVCCPLPAQEMREGASAFLLSEDPMQALLEDDTKLDIPFGQRITIEEVVPNHIAARYQGQRALFEAADVFRSKQAKVYLEELVKRKPSSANFFVKAQVELVLRNVQQSMDDLDMAIQLDAGNAVAWAYRGSAKSLRKDYQGAEEDIDQALELDPDLAIGNSLKFYILQKTNRQEEALPYIRKAVELDPHRALYHSNLGSVLLQLEMKEESIQSFKKAIEVEPAYYTGHYFMGYQLFHADKHDEAKPHLKRSSELYPRHYWTHYYLARVAKEEGNETERILHFGLSAKAVDAPASIRNQYAWQLATSMDEALRDGEMALKFAKELIDPPEIIGSERRVPDSTLFKYQKTLAAAYAELGDFETAIATLKKIDNSVLQDAEIDEMLDQFRDGQPFRSFEDE